MSDNPHDPSASGKNKSESDPGVSKGSPESRPDEDSRKKPAQDHPAVSSESGKPAPETGPVQARKTRDSEQAGKDASGRSIGPDESLAPKDNPEDKVDGFEKHDHDKYVQSVKEKAIQVVKKEKNAFFARLCRDTVDVWTLTTYQKQNSKTLAMTTFVWDPVDQSWLKTISDEMRLPHWKIHLSVSAAGKECEVLKGTEEAVRN